MIRCWTLMLLTVVGFVGTGSTALATHPVVQTPYRFLPRYSTLTETYGFPRESVDFRVLGTFDLALDGDHSDPWAGTTAKFANVNAWASHPVLAYVLMLDDVLNLSGLTGRQLPVAGPFDAYQFVGTTRDGSHVDLFATVLGPWFYLNGGTTPATDALNAVSYEINALARTRPWADFNSDGFVDDKDLALLRSNYGSTDLDSYSVTRGDADGDGDVDGRDFLLWQRHANESPPLAALEAAVASTQATLASTVTVPEPHALLLTGIALCVFGVLRSAKI